MLFSVYKLLMLLHFLRRIENISVAEKSQIAGFICSDVARGVSLTYPFIYTPNKPEGTVVLSEIYRT
jgi:hypothetical protein